MIQRKVSGNKRGGYSLFEILVALIIIGLTAAVVAPGMTASLNSAARHSARLYLEQSILSIRRAALSDDRDYVFSQEPVEGDDIQLAPLSLPGGWEVEVEPAIRFSANGNCTGGLVSIRAKDQAAFEHYRIEPPSCRPVG